MKSLFFRRVLAFVIDFFIVNILFSIITVGFESNSSLIEEADDLLTKYNNQEITIDVYNENIQRLNYELQKSNISINILSFVVIVGYYFVFNYLNGGRTIGKKICKIKIVEKNNKPSIKAIILRGLFIYGSLSTLYNIIFVFVFDVTNFSRGYTIVTYIEALLMMICLFTILYRKDKRGLHDIVAGTEVIEEVNR